MNNNKIMLLTTMYRLMSRSGRVRQVPRVVQQPALQHGEGIGEVYGIWYIYIYTHNDTTTNEHNNNTS